MISDFCTGDLNMKGGEFFNKFNDTINQIDDTTGTWTSNLMCTTDYCACPSNIDFTLWNETELNYWNRTNSVVKAAANSQYKILYKNATGLVNYTSFYDCYKHIIELKNSNSNYLSSSSSTANKVEELSDGFIDLLRVLED